MSIFFSYWCVLISTLTVTIATTNAAITENVALLESNNKFGNKLYNSIAEQGENIVFSPFSLHAVLSLLYAGADGKTKTVLKAVLELPEQSDISPAYKHLIEYIKSRKNVTLKIANKIYAADNLKLVKEFQIDASTNYDAEIEQVNFKETTKTVEIINEWVKERTYNKIRHILKPNQIDPTTTRFVLVNTLYFNGKWPTPFITEEQKFYISGSETIDCTMLTKKSDLEYFRTETFKFIRIPYQDQTISLALVLPLVRTGLADLEEKFATDGTFFNFSGMYKKVVVSIPKFKMETDIPLKPILQKMGLADIFVQLDIPKMVEAEPNLAVSDVVQRVFIDVNENGTEGAAASESNIHSRSSLIYFTADHPFLFFLEASVEGQRHVLFQGRITKPEYK